MGTPTATCAPDDLARAGRPVSTRPPRLARARSAYAIIFRLRSGCQWNRLPREFPDDSSVHRTFQRWVRAGVFERIWATLVKQCAELGGVSWEWQAADAALGKARLGGITSAGTPRIAANGA